MSGKKILYLALGILGLGLGALGAGTAFVTGISFFNAGCLLFWQKL